jgi:hypothetical protein
MQHIEGENLTGVRGLMRRGSTIEQVTGGWWTHHRLISLPRPCSKGIQAP